MVAIDLQLLFDDRIGRFMEKDIKVFTSTEVERFLNTALTSYVNALADMFEYNEKARRSLAGITKSAQLSLSQAYPTGTLPINDNAYTSSGGTELPTDLLRIVEEQAIIGGERIPIKPITHDQYLANIKNPYKKPYDDLVWRLDFEGQVEYISDGSVITSAEIRYIAKPSEISFDEDTPMQLPDADMDNVVDIAVGLAVNSLAVGRQEGN